MQSHVPEHTECAWLMECTVSFGELRRMTQFKDKSDRHDFISAGLFTYPALQAADILLYDTDEVPVGDDQRQHVEITRDIAERFNSHYGETFVVPKAVVPEAGARIMDLQRPADKMSKSLDSPRGSVGLLDEPGAVERKIKAAVTDSESEVRFDFEAKPGVSNLLSILGAATDRDPAELAGQYTRYGPLKADAAAAVIEPASPAAGPLRRAGGRPGRDRPAASGGGGQGRGHRRRHPGPGQSQHRPAGTPRPALRVDRRRSASFYGRATSSETQTVREKPICIQQCAQFANDWSSDWLCPAVAFLVLANTIGACGWNHETTCRKPTLTGTGTVALRLIEAKHVKLEASYEESTSTNKGTSTVGNFHIGRPNWYSHNLGDDGAILSLDRIRISDLGQDIKPRTDQSSTVRTWRVRSIAHRDRW